MAAPRTTSHSMSEREPFDFGFPADSLGGDAPGDWMVMATLVLQPAEAVQGPDPGEGAADDVVFGDGADVAGVARVGPVVAHHEDLAGLHLARLVERARQLALGRRGAGREV